jgi:hypothetical protein
MLMTQRARSAVEAVILTVLAAAGLLFGLTATAYAASGAEAAGDAMPSASQLFEAVKAGHYWYAAAGALVLVVAVLRKKGPDLPVVGKYLKWASGSWGGRLLVVLASLTGALANALAAGAAPSLSMVWAALGVAVAAAGGYDLFKLAVPILEALQSKLPAWAQPFVGILLWAFKKDDPVTKAEAAGDAAVKANPPAGVIAITGKPVDWPPPRAKR